MKRKLDIQTESMVMDIVDELLKPFNDGLKVALKQEGIPKKSGLKAAYDYIPEVALFLANKRKSINPNEKEKKDDKD